MLKSYERQHRIEFLHRTWCENDTTNNLESLEKSLIFAWTTANPVLKGGKFDGSYLFGMHKSIISDARHACANALRWNRKVLTITNQCSRDDLLEVWAKEGESWQTMAS